MSALSDRTLTQSPASRALEVWAQTLREPLVGVTLDPPLDASWLVTFHGGTVDLLQEPPEDYQWPSDFGCAVFPANWAGEDLKLGNSEFPITIRTACYYKELKDTRAATEAGVEDLVFYLSAAVASQRQLVWKSEFVAAPPDGNIVQGGAGVAQRREAVSPVVFERFYDKDNDCLGIAAFIDAVWIISILTC